VVGGSRVDVDENRDFTLRDVQNPGSDACDDGAAIGASQVEPLKTGAEPESLTATLTWGYPNKRVKGGIAPYSGVHLTISTHPDLSSSIVDAKIPDHVNSFRLAVTPDSKYYWRILPFDKDGEASNRMSEGNFVTGKPVIENTESDLIRYRNP
jgi:hypothetical protein